MVFPDFPVKSPNNGFFGNAFIKSDVLTDASFHLKIKTPFVFKTRQHSQKPSTKSSFQVLEFNTPYFLLITLFMLPRLMCGGSKTTTWKDLVLKGIWRKSANMSGLTHQFGFQLFWNAPFSTCRSSWNNAIWLFFSYQNMRPPQQASKTAYLLILFFCLGFSHIFDW